MPPFPFRLDFPPELPISARAEEIVAAIQEHPVVILAGETGSGKTTQIPKMCLAAGRGARGRIACTQPRRVAALSISRRVAEELGVGWGREVGCKVRFQDQTTPGTVIKFLTDGMLLAEVQGDPLLREYDTIIIDEAHERSLNIDFLLGHLRQLRHRRADLRIIVTSATIDTAAFSKAFDDAPVIQVEGRTFPVEVIYAPLDGSVVSDSPDSPDTVAASPAVSAKAETVHYIDGTVDAVQRILRDSTTGDILVFMPSERDIRETTDLLAGGLQGRQRPEVIPLFGRLSSAEQQRVFAPSNVRKIVVATNVAETSLTIPGIHYVVDTGLARLSRYSPQARTRRLPIEPISQSSADQRKGRSGRVAHGVCIRLYSEKDFLERPRYTQPEIQRSNLADVILRMKAFGLGDIERFPFINMPAAKSIRAGYALLEELGALARPEDRARLTDDGAASSSTHPPSSDLRPPSSDSGLSTLGLELARLPVDPTVGRTILQARVEKALREVLVIAAGLSIQDPRERPLDKQAQADAAHRRFSHPDSDFLTLLNLWESTHGEFDTMSQARLRRYCREHFLSYTRMREWRDIHDQLRFAVGETVGASGRGGREAAKVSSVFDGMEDSEAKREEALRFGRPAYRAIHRSLLTGLLANIAHRQEDGSLKSTHDRKVSIFPGSTLFVRSTQEKARSGQKAAPKVPPWIMAGEIVETARLYARMCARLDPSWVLDLAGHLVRVSHSEPFWDETKGRVLVKQRTQLYGLELETRAVSYGRVDPRHATEIFIREALVNDTITWPFDFLRHNRQIRAEVESLLTRTRDRGYQNLDEATYQFYAARLAAAPGRRGLGASPSSSNPLSSSETPDLTPPTSSVAELVDLVRERRGAEPRFLMMTMEDLRDPAAPEPDAEAYPADLPMENRVLALAYAYKPGSDDDGVTLEVRLRDAAELTQAALDWAVPGHLEAKVEHLLRTLPKELRRAFMPLAETARSVAGQLEQRDRLTGRRETLAEALVAVLRERSGVAIPPAVWAHKPLPDHLRVRVRVIDDAGRELCASRELDQIRGAIAAVHREASATAAAGDPAVWKQARDRWEKSSQGTWTFGDIPARIAIGDQSGVPLHAYPGLRAGTEGVSLRLFPSPEEAAAASQVGIARLLELQLRHEIGWLARELRDLRQLGALTATLAPIEQLRDDALEAIRLWVTDPSRLPANAAEDSPAFTAAQFAAALEKARADLRGIVPRLVEQLREILALRQELLVHPQPYPGMDRDLGALVPPDVLRRTPYARLAHFPRYLKAMKLRAERARKNPAKDAERAAQLAPYLGSLARVWAKPIPPSPGAGLSTFNSQLSTAERLRWLLEEFRVSLFAQELGTAEPVSAAKLDRILAELSPGANPVPAPASPVLPPMPRTPRPDEKAKPTSLKSLGALDKIFGKGAR